MRFTFSIPTVLSAFLLAGVLSSAALAPALAVQPDEILDDPALEERAREISKVLRCIVCQNQSIDDSDAPLARDLRLLVRERLVAGDSDDGVKDYLVARYGDYVLLKPPIKPTTYLLWGGPILLFLLALLTTGLYFRRRASEARAQSGDTPLSADEQARLAKLLDDDSASKP